jgi:hypothetical protein
MTTKRLFKPLLLAAILLLSSVLFSQNKRLKVEIENISLKAPENWKANKEDTPEGFTIKLNNDENTNHVVVSCIKKTTNLEATIVNSASQKSTLSGFEYMLIEKVKSKPFGDYKAKFLEYTNSPLRDYFRGGFWSFIDRGYTYVVDYYSADVPEQRDQVGKIVSSLKILAPESRPNFFVVEKEYAPENIIVPEVKPQDTVFEQQVADSSATKTKKSFLFFKKKAKQADTNVKQVEKQAEPVVKEDKKEAKATKKKHFLFF